MAFLSYEYPAMDQTVYMDAQTLGMFHKCLVSWQFLIFNLKRKLLTLFTTAATGLDSQAYSHAYSFKPI